MFSQTRLPDEVIVIDDGSTDGTEEMLAQSFPQVIYIKQDNCGVSSARNSGIALAAGEWIALLDSDDKWMPEKLAQQEAALRAKPEYLICHTEEIWIRNGVRVNQMRKHRKYGGWIYQRCLPLCAISPSSVLIHKSVFHEIGVFDENLPACEDYDLWLRMCSKYPVLYLDQPLIKKYGGHEDQLSRRYWGMDRFRIQSLASILKHGELDPNLHDATREMLVKKISVYVKGAQKRGKLEEVHRYKRLIREL